MKYVRDMKSCSVGTKADKKNEWVKKMKTKNEIEIAKRKKSEDILKEMCPDYERWVIKEGEKKMKSEKAIREIVLSDDYLDYRGMKITKGTKLFVTKELPKHPITKTQSLIVRVDNGTGILDLMPETMIQQNRE